MSYVCKLTQTLTSVTLNACKFVCPAHVRTYVHTYMMTDWVLPGNAFHTDFIQK